jgi:hypothetical protein
MGAAPQSLADWVDLERYPLEDDTAMAAVIRDSRLQLAQSSFACLPGFLKPGAAAAMTREALEAVPRAYRRERSFSAYEEADLERYPEGHVRRRKHLSRQYVVPSDILSRSGLLRSLYASHALRGRIAQMLDEPELHALADPVMACTCTVMYDGDTHGWHFDLNDFVVSILLQAPEAGGTFDFAPNIRDAAQENYDAVADVLDGRSPHMRSVKVEAGTLLLFCGRRALHCVPPVAGPIPRVIALFSYDRRPGVHYGPEQYQRVVGRRTVYEN